MGSIALLKTLFIGIPIITFIVIKIFKDSRPEKIEMTDYRKGKNYRYFKRLNKKLEDEKNEK